MHPSPLAFSHLKCLVSIARGLTVRGAMTSLKQRGQRWGVMRLAQIGIPAVALLGIPLFRTQVPHPTNRPYARWRPDLDPHDLANLELSCRLLPLLP